MLTLANDGRAIMVYSSDGERCLRFKVHRRIWHPVNHNGLLLMRRPVDPVENDDGKRGGAWRTGSVPPSAGMAADSAMGESFLNRGSTQ